MAAGDGLVSMTPTSIAHSGTSASINADGGVDFTAVTSLSLNGVFTSDYDNYLIVYRALMSANNRTIAFNLRASGADATGSDYTSQLLRADNTSVTGTRVSNTFGYFPVLSATAQNGVQVHVYGPFLAQPTAYRTVGMRGQNSAYFDDGAGTHSLSTSYDGFTIGPSADNMTGNIHVFGYEE